MNSFTPQQSVAVHARGNLLVVAGAGTGKTHTLIARCLRLVAEERVSVENILMVTFTEAAAAEMRARLRNQLQVRSLAGPGDEHLAEQLALLDVARISTLHGFCLQLLRGHFHELGLDPQFGVLDEQQTRPLQHEALDEILERHYAATGKDGEDTPVQQLIRAVGHGSDVEVRKLVFKLHAFTQSLADPAGWIKDQELFFGKTDTDEWRKVFVEVVMALRAEWLGKIKTFSGAPAVDIAIGEMEKLSQQPDFQQAAEAMRMICTADNDRKKNWPRGTIGKVRKLIERFFDDAESLAAFAPDEKSDPLVDDWKWCRGQMLALLSLVREFGAVYAAKKRELGGVDFSDLEQNTLRLLYRDDGSPSPVAHEWQSRLAHVVVDEYQDINAAQDAILAAVSRKGAEANRFLVGDVKQSIYRFRLANPKIFQGYHREWDAGGNNGAALSLTENFRSRGAVLNFVNSLFGSLMREEIGGVGYEALEFGNAGRRAVLASVPDEPHRVELHIIAGKDEPDGDDSGEPDDAKAAQPDLQAVEREARLVAKRLRDLKNAGHQVWDKDENRFREVKWSDMAVLLRSPNGRAESFAKEFNRAGIPLSAARDGFYSSLEVSDLLNLLKLLDNPLQDVPLVAVLRSPLVGLSLEELAAVRAGAVRELFWTSLVKKRNTERLQPNKIDAFITSIHRWRELVQQTSLSQTLETALAETHYEAMLLAEERGSERVSNVRRLLDLARQFDPYQRQGLYRFLKFIRLQEDEELDLQPATATAGDAVRLMSVHRSKGLEFPVVVLATLGTQFNEQDLRGTVLFGEQRGLCPKITPPSSEESYPGITHWMAGRAEKRELSGEELRLFYVAATRARDHLILIGTTKTKATDVTWQAATNANIGTDEVLKARNHLGWLQRWLPSVTTAESWKDDRSGANGLLCWKIYDGSEPEFAPPVVEANMEAQAAVETKPEAGEIASLKSRLGWNYPQAEATRRAAKTSVTILRRQADEEIEFKGPGSRFNVQGSKPSSFARGLSNPAKFSAAETGTAHHAFLEHFNIAGAVDEAGLRTEAERLSAAGLLSVEQAGAVDVSTLARFWNSEVGRMIRSRATAVKREMEFTARFVTGELDELLRAAGDVSAGGIAEEDFVVVQGVADLAVMLPEEIWLLDFKTDAVTTGGVREKAEKYSVQLRLYARALSRIHRRPVRKCWLHFLAVGETEDVDVS